MDESELKQEIQTIDARGSALVIDSADKYVEAGSMVIALDELIKRINTYWEEPIKKAYETHRALTAKRGEMLKPVEGRRANLKSLISRYLTAQENKRKEEQRKADEARRKAEEAEREKLLARAAKADERGNQEKAEALLNQAEDVYIPPVIVAAEIEKTTRTDAGTITEKRDIQIRITDTKSVLKAVIDGIIPPTVININETKLKQFIKISGIEKLAGVEITEIMLAQFRKREAS